MFIQILTLIPLIYYRRSLCNKHQVMTSLNKEIDSTYRQTKFYVLYNVTPGKQYRISYAQQPQEQIARTIVYSYNKSLSVEQLKSLSLDWQFPQTTNSSFSQKYLKKIQWSQLIEQSSQLQFIVTPLSQHLAVFSSFKNLDIDVIQWRINQIQIKELLYSVLVVILVGSCSLQFQEELVFLSFTAFFLLYTQEIGIVFLAIIRSIILRSRVSHNVLIANHILFISLIGSNQCGVNPLVQVVLITAYLIFLFNQIKHNLQFFVTNINMFFLSSAIFSYAFIATQLFNLTSLNLLALFSLTISWLLTAQSKVTEQSALTQQYEVVEIVQGVGTSLTQESH